MRTIYLDYNASTPVRPDVADAIGELLEGDFGNPSSLHRFGRAARAARERARDQVARAAGCAAESVIFTSGGTEANNLALRGIAASSPRKHFVSAATEHEAVLQTLEALGKLGAEVTILAVDRDGAIHPEELARAIRDDTVLVSLMAANNETGVLHPLEELGSVCRDRGVPFHTDAVQCFGKRPFAFDELPVDLASISSHKIGGPKGAGALLVRRGVGIRAQITGGSQERGIRPGTENLPGIVGFGKAAELASQHVEVEGRRLSLLRRRLEEGALKAFETARVNGGSSERLPNTTNISFPGLDGESLLAALDLEGIAVSTGAACNSGAAEPSHVLLAMGCAPKEAGGSIRFSLGAGTTSSEIEEVITILPQVAARVASAGSQALKGA